VERRLIAEVNEDQIVRDVVRAQEIATQSKNLSFDRQIWRRTFTWQVEAFPFAVAQVGFGFRQGLRGQYTKCGDLQSRHELVHTFGALRCLFPNNPTASYLKIRRSVRFASMVSSVFLRRAILTRM